MKNVFIWLLFLIFFPMLFSCQKDISTEPNSNNMEDYKVSLEKAKSICEQPNLKNGRIEADKVVVTAKTKKNSKGEDVYHVISYGNGKGYRVVSADKRAFPLLVESDMGDFDTTVTGVSIWMHGLEGYIDSQKIKKISNNEDQYLKSLWKDFEETGDPLKQIKLSKNIKGGRVAGLPNDGGGAACQDQYSYNSNFLSTNWAQWGGYNNFCPPDPCGAPNGYCGRVPAGCGAVAMAQIMFRHQKPFGFNYGLMNNATNNPFTCSFNSGQTEIARLVKYAGEKAGSTPISTQTPWSCSTSTSTFPWAIPSAFANAGYSSGGNSQDYVFNNVVNDLLQGYPVIISGTKG